MKDPDKGDSGSQISKLVGFLLSAGVLKSLPRTGWRMVGIKECESVADHCYRVVLIALVLGELVEKVDRDKLLRMAVLHELPEILVTDLPLAAVKVIGRDVKHRAEHDTWERLLPPGARLESWRALWEEYEAGRTVEAKLARAADRIDMLLQAIEYQRTGYQNLDGFWDDSNFEDYGVEPVRLIMAELRGLRDGVDTRS